MESAICEINGDDGYLDCDLNISGEIPRTSEISISLENQRKNGEFKMFGRKLQHNLCDYIKNDKLFYPGFLRYGNVPKSCPVSQKTIQLRKYKPHVEDFPTMFAPGLWRSNFTLSLPKENVLIYKIVLLVEIFRK